MPRQLRIALFAGSTRVLDPRFRAPRVCARLAPHAELIEEWRDAGPEKRALAIARIEGFLTVNASMSMFADVASV